VFTSAGCALWLLLNRRIRHRIRTFLIRCLCTPGCTSSCRVDFQTFHL
jgi:hypothetical protein